LRCFFLSSSYGEIQHKPNVHVVLNTMDTFPICQTPIHDALNCTRYCTVGLPCSYGAKERTNDQLAVLNALDAWTLSVLGS